MNERVNFKRLEIASFTLLLVIAITIALLFFETLSLQVFKICLLFLLVAASVIFLLLRVTIAQILKKGIQRFQSAESKFQKLVESNLIGIITSNHAGVVLEANDAFLKMVGYTRQDLEGSKILWEEVILDESKDLTRKALGDLERVGYYRPMEKHLERKDGSKLWVLCGSAELQRDGHSDIVSFIVDISRRKEAEEKATQLQKELTTQQEEFESVFMNAPAFISIRRGPDLRYVFVNKAFNPGSGTANQIEKSHAEVFRNIFSQKEESLAAEVYRTGKAITETAYRVEIKKENADPQVLYVDYTLASH
jgi:PAS domain S-box-containing protein